MNTTELIATLAQKLALPKTEVARRLGHTVDAITSELLQNRPAPLPPLGTLEIKKRNERIGLNPASGKRLLIPPKLIVKFKPSHTLKVKLKGKTP
jgi:nucleoid DNA-binding protein